MFSYEERKKAVVLYFKYHNNSADVIRELGYLTRGALRCLIKEFKEENALHKKHKRKSKYTDEQRNDAINHYLDHG